jgi:HSP20 family molecular chaperone IbpA
MSPVFHQRAFYPQETTFQNLFRLLDDFDSYYQAKPQPKGNCRPAARLPSFNPRFDVRETENTYELHGELPGIEKKDLSIDFNDQNITVHGRIQRSYSAGTPPVGLLEQDNINTEKQPEANNDNTSAPRSPSPLRATVTDEADEEGFENVSTTSDVATPAETVKETDVTPAPAAAPKQPAERYWHQERSIGEFHRTFSFPNRIDEAGVTAKLDNGVLHVSVPKAAKPVSRRIAID